MKIKKQIAKLLVLGFILNNISILSNTSFADIDIPDRYQTLQGEHISISDSIDDELVELEVLGNTVRNKDDLNDIQSVGDLYVDEDGRPILDKQDNEQYVINIESANDVGYQEINTEYNNENIELTYGHGREHYFEDNDVRIVYKSTSISRTEFDISGLKPNTSYRLTGKLKLLTDNNEAILNITNGSNVFELVGLNSYYSQHRITASESDINLTATSTVDGTLKLRFFNVYFTSSGISFNGDVLLENMLLSKNVGDINDINESTKHSNHNIILPDKLEGINGIDFRGGQKDRLYYDSVKNKYILEKHIKEVTKNISEIEDSYFSIKTGPTDEYVTLELPISVVANDVKRYSVIYVNNMDFSRKDYNYTVFLHDAHVMQFFMPISDLADDTLESALLRWKEVIGSELKLKYISSSPQLIETNITSKLKIPTYDSQTHLYVKTKNGINPTLKVTMDRLPQIANNYTEEAVSIPTSNNVSKARIYINMLPESLYKDQLQSRLNALSNFEDLTFNKKTATANLDVYIKSENMLSMSLDTNSVTFDNYSGATPMELTDAVNITINSSLPYDLNAYMPVEISNNDGSSKIPFSIFNIKESSETNYNQFVDKTNKVVLKASCVEGNNKSHKIDLKLDSNTAHKADIYKTVIKFEAEQK